MCVYIYISIYMFSRVHVVAMSTCFCLLPPVLMSTVFATMFVMFRLCFGDSSALASAGWIYSARGWPGSLCEPICRAFVGDSSAIPNAGWI